MMGSAQGQRVAAVAMAGKPLRPSAPDRPALKALALSIDRMDALLAEETAALQNMTPFDLQSSNNRKSHFIVELNNAIRALRPGDLDSEMKDRIARLRQRLGDNLAVIKLHLAAAQEIAGVLSQTAQNAESDGTYSRTPQVMRGWL